MLIFLFNKAADNHTDDTYAINTLFSEGQPLVQVKYSISPFYHRYFGSHFLNSGLPR